MWLNRAKFVRLDIEIICRFKFIAIYQFKIVASSRFHNEIFTLFSPLFRLGSALSAKNSFNQAAKHKRIHSHVESFPLEKIQHEREAEQVKTKLD